MNKGFIFTIDAFYAMIFVALLAGGFAFYYNTAQTNSKQIENLNMQTTDTALVAFYFGKSTIDYPDFQKALSTDANFSTCNTLYNYTMQTSNAGGSPPFDQSPVSLNKFCKRIR